MTTKLNVARFLPCTRAEGPGPRAAVWVQGCLKRCPGCCNPGLLPIAPARLVTAEEAWQWVRAAGAERALEGVTFLGGEPMLQARGLAEVAERCHAAGLSVMVFSGYTREELTHLALPGADDLLRHTDVLVDGPYRAELPERERNWVGSSNQRFHYLTERYGPEIETDPRYRPAVELRVASDGRITLNGWPTGLLPVRNSS
jgi:anaerobic ribonucleoside-triphosphate reductase activating protein